MCKEGDCLAPTRQSKPSTLCPLCGEPVYRRRHAHGKQRYAHRTSQRLSCVWTGTEAVGREKDAITGVPKEQADALHRRVVGNQKKRTTYVITAAQNATPVPPTALRSPLPYCKVNKVQFLVTPYRYKTPTSWWAQRPQHDDWW